MLFLVRHVLSFEYEHLQNKEVQKIQQCSQYLSNCMKVFFFGEEQFLYVIFAPHECIPLVGDLYALYKHHYFLSSLKGQACNTQEDVFPSKPRISLLFLHPV